MDAWQNANELMPEWQLIVYAAIGSFVLYCKLRTDARPMIEFLPHLAPGWNSPLRPACEALLFVVIGGVMSYGLVEPTTVPQALSAGLGWIGLASAIVKSTGKRKGQP